MPNSGVAIVNYRYTTIKFGHLEKGLKYSEPLIQTKNRA